MPRFFFDVENGGLTVDEDGVQLDDVASVRPVAISTLLDIAKSEAIANDEHEMTVTARDESGARIYHLSVSLKEGWPSDAAE